ncbi:hypothetical protein [Granulicella sp. dw_53]|uniref:hypothetical protein n=1 Tax=Granulicella sp. dw_53 TaxID=2719792 RepID=UPI001BD34073|nr:hypothetical protein [Granulicella sp. dw_53]
MHRLSSSFVLGYHGCQRQTGEKLLAGEPFVPSENDYDWLGPGIYFWESNPRRAMEWAALSHQRKYPEGLSEPFVVGAAIDLGFCLDLLSSNGLAAVKAAHEDFAYHLQMSNRPLPRNSGGEDLLSRRLDCAVLGHLHDIRSRSIQPAFDTVRGVFIEGAPIYPNSGFREKTHIQIAICNPDVIKGVFRVPQKDLE